ncbi:MAG: polysaccharide deacetylase family protein [Rubrivivax sp.]
MEAPSPNRRQAGARLLGCLCGSTGPGLAWSALALPGVEPRHRLLRAETLPPLAVALTLDACGGAFDHTLIDTLIQRRVAATVFTTARWLRGNPQGLRTLLAHPTLFELENHGAEHRPALVGATLYGMHGPADLAGVEREINGGAAAITATGQPAPRWFRGAGARYDAASLQLIAQRGLRVAGYSLNADDGATAAAATVERRLLAAQAGDIILAHMNKPAGGTAEGLAAAMPTLQQRGLQFVKLSQVPQGLALLPAEPPAPPARRNTPAG